MRHRMLPSEPQVPRARDEWQARTIRVDRMARKGNPNQRYSAVVEQNTSCDTCLVRDHAICGKFSPAEIAAINTIARRRRLKAGQQLALDDEAPEYFGILMSGSVKLTKVLPDGRQQIVGLLFPSDFVGRPFEAQGGCYAEAATDVTLCSFPTAPFERLAREHPGIQHQLFRYALGQLAAAQDWMLLLGRKTAREKVVSLLIMTASRLRATGCAQTKFGSHIEFALPLSRSDIADYLGLTLETVSRQFRILKSEELIRVNGSRGLTVLDLEKLQASASHPPAQSS